MKQKGQVTLFILLGVVLLIIVGVLFYVLSTASVENLDPLSLESLQSSYEACGSQAFRDALILIGKHSGYLNVPEEQQVPELAAAYWDSTHFRSSEDVARALAQHLTTTIPQACQNLPKAFAKTSTELSVPASPNVRISINENDVSALIDWSITAQQGEKTSALNQITFAEPVRLKHALALAHDLTNDYKATGMINQDRCSDVDMMLALKDEDILLAFTGNLGFLTDRTPYYFWFALKKT